MPGENALGSLGFDHSLLIGAAPARVQAAFFDPQALAVWWQAIRSVTTARPFGVYAIEWEPTEFRDELLGRLGGVFHGTVMDVEPGRQFFIADAWWLPPEADPLGPMGLEVTCSMDGPACRLRVRQSGCDDSPRWRRYYEVIGGGWQASLAALKHYLEYPPRNA
jgi:uncharacterized protein YndB with AHSA1/START domain